MKKSLPKLTLSRETLRRLDESRLENAAGGAKDAVRDAADK